MRSLCLWSRITGDVSKLEIQDSNKGRFAREIPLIWAKATQNPTQWSIVSLKTLICNGLSLHGPRCRPRFGMPSSH